VHLEWGVKGRDGSLMSLPTMKPWSPILEKVSCSVVEPELQGAETLGRSRSWNVEASAPAPGSGSA
jgi:hypothetical protein